MWRDRNPEHWKVWVFYYNPDEPRLFVRRRGASWTLNYAKPAAWAITMACVAVPVVGALIDLAHFGR